MRKFVRVAVIVCLSIVAFPAAVIGALSVWGLYKTESFYWNHPLLRDMRAVQRESTNDSGPAREALLQILPLGSDKDAAVAVLRDQGIGCQAIGEPVTDTRLRRHFLETLATMNQSDDSLRKTNWIDCQVGAPNGAGFTQWIVDLEFDANERLSDAGVAMWYIFL